MATLFNSLFDRLTVDATLAPLVGSRVWENEALQQVFPYVVISYEEEEDTALQAAPAPTYHVVISVESQDADMRDTIARAIKTSINRQQWIDNTNGVNVAVALLTGERRDTQNVSGIVETVVYTTDQTYEIIAAF